MIPDRFPFPDLIFPIHPIPYLDASLIATWQTRLAYLLPPEVTRSAQDLHDYAMAYVDMYHGDTFQIEYAWDILFTALSLAWNQERYSVVTHLANALLPVLFRVNNTTVAEHILNMGKEASRKTHHRRNFMVFSLKHIFLVFARGKYTEGHALWDRLLADLEHERIALEEVWEPLIDFAKVFDIVQYSATAPTVFLRATEAEGDTRTVFLLMQGIIARAQQRPDEAYELLGQCFQCLPSQPAFAAQRHLIRSIILTEMARVEGNVQHATALAVSTLALAQPLTDALTVTGLLIDQGRYAERLGAMHDRQMVLQRLEVVCNAMDVPRLDAFLNNLPRTHQPQRQKAILTTRERDILALVEQGLSNVEIAQVAVLSPKTVKKHLDNIYTKLGVHSRTAAVTKLRHIL